MITNFFKIAFRNMISQKGYTLINITGLAIGLAATLMILLWIQHELSYDKFFSDSDQLYRVEEDQYYGAEPYHVNVTPYPCAPVWKERIPEVTEACRYVNLPRVLFERGEKRLFETNVKAVDSSFFDMFDFKLIMGDPKMALVNPHSIILTEEMASKYFGDENPLGEGLTLEKEMEFIVTGVLEDLPDNTVLSFDGLIPLSFMYEIGAANDSWGSNSILTYLKIPSGSDLEAVGKKLTDIVIEYNPRTSMIFMVNPVTRIHLHGYFGYANPIGSMVYIYIFAAIALFVLVIACINFINLSTARSVKRAREIGIKKVSGALKTSMVIQFLLESVLQVFIALFFALVIVGLLLGLFNGITGKEFSVSDIFSPRFIAGYILIAITAGLVAGIYPALFLSSFKPVTVLKGDIGGGRGSGSMRKGLVVIQFVLSIFLAVCGIVIYRQIDHMRSVELGYNKDEVVRISMLDNVKAKYYTLKSELERSPVIESVSASTSRPTYIGSNSGSISWEGKDPDQRSLMGINGVDYDYTETMQIEMVAGRSFSKDYEADLLVDTVGNFLINEVAAREIGIDDPIGLRFNYGGISGTIVGVMKNFYFKPASEVIEPIVFMCTPTGWLNEIIIRFTPGSQDKAIAQLQEIWQNTIPEYPLDYTFIADDIDSLYRTESRMGSLFRIFTFLAIIIASLGLFGLSSYVTEQRTREIGVRKIMGSSAGEVMILLSREFVILVLIAAALGFPLSWLYLRDWLQEFPYRTGINATVFVIVGLAAIIVALITVSYQSYRAAMTNPASTIRAE